MISHLKLHAKLTIEIFQITLVELGIQIVTLHHRHNELQAVPYVVRHDLLAIDQQIAGHLVFRGQILQVQNGQEMLDRLTVNTQVDTDDAQVVSGTNEAWI